MKQTWELFWILLAIFVIVFNGYMIAKLCEEAGFYYIAGLLATRYLSKQK
jgi:hypothetical protein